MDYTSPKVFSRNRGTETELLICCARTQLNAEIVERIHHFVRNGVDWGYFVETATQHRVMPLVYQNLGRTCREIVPHSILERFRGHFMANTVRNLQFEGKLLELLSLLKQYRIPAMPFKGPVLAEYAYGDVALRQFVDLDILVRKCDALKALSLLVSRGYRPDIALNASQYAAYINTEDSIAATSSDGRIAVDLHWEMTGRYSYFPYRLEELEDRLEETSFADGKVMHLSPEDLLLYLCLQGAKDFWGNLGLVCDVAELLHSRQEIDWNRVGSFARQRHSSRILAVGLLLAHNLLEAPVPYELLEGFKADVKAHRLAKEVYRRLFHEHHAIPLDELTPRFSRFHIKVRDGLLDRIWYGFQLATVPTIEDWRLFPVPAGLSLLHYLFRPIRLAVGLGSGLLKRHLKKSGASCRHARVQRT